MLGGEEIVPSQRNLFLPIPLPDYDDESMSTTPQILGIRHRNTTITDNASDWRSQRPLGISCAATLFADDELRLWHGGDRANPNDRMSQQEAAALVHYLEDRTKEGYTILTWNGLGFDFDILAEESQMLHPMPRPGARPRGHDVPRLLPARSRRRSRRRRPGHGACGED